MKRSLALADDLDDFVQAFRVHILPAVGPRACRASVSAFARAGRVARRELVELVVQALVQFNGVVLKGASSCHEAMLTGETPCCCSVVAVVVG